MLYKLVLKMDRSTFANEIISLTNWHEQCPEWEPVSKQLDDSGVRVRALRMRRGMLGPWQFLRLVEWIRQSRPDVVQTWMYHANFVGGLAARLAGAPVVWGLHHSNLDPRYNKRHTIWTALVCARLSHTIPARIVCCSESARQLHFRRGYAAQKMAVISNGFELNQFHPNPEARSSIRRELGLPEATRMIGLAARFHPLKGHRNFIAAAVKLHADLPDVHFLFCGRDVDENNVELSDFIRACGPRFTERCHLLGVRQDMPRFFAAIDIATSASVSEAFPVAVGEAMACGTPCVVTDVGDCSALVAGTGRVVPPDDPTALARAWTELLTSEPHVLAQLGKLARARVQQQFALGSFAQAYEEVYRNVACWPSKVASETSGAVLPDRDVALEAYLDVPAKPDDGSCIHAE